MHRLHLHPDRPLARLSPRILKPRVQIWDPLPILQFRPASADLSTPIENEE